MVALSYAAFLFWRWETYGELVPNTYYAKTGGGLRSYLFGFKYAIAGFGSVNALLLLFAPFAFLKFSEHRMVVGLLVSVLFALIFFMMYSGGDWMPGFRFIVPAIPLLAILAVMSMKAIIERFNGSLVKYSSLVLSTLFIAVLGSVFSGRTLIRAQAPSMGSAFYSSDGHLMPSHKLVSEWLKAHSDSTTLFACGEAGLIGYENIHLRMIDLNGLMDKHIARERKDNVPFDVDYVLDKKPKYVILHGSKEEDRERMNYARSTDYFGMLGESKRLHDEYRLAFTTRSFDVYERK
jgi:arabinofuranosyltransferase